jgi:hypothetical protein
MARTLCSAAALAWLHVFETVAHFVHLIIPRVGLNAQGVTRPSNTLDYIEIKYNEINNLLCIMHLNSNGRFFPRAQKASKSPVQGCADAYAACR